jgi:hypothetical protein
MAESSGEVKPQSQFEIGRPPADGQEALSEKALEQRPQTEAAQAKQKPQFPAPPSVQTIPVSQPQAGQSSKPKSAKAVTGGLTALEGDRIEKQWVESAKSIIAQTQDDPYNQKRQMSKIKADYIKKRFDKTIPADDALSP